MSSHNYEKEAEEVRQASYQTEADKRKDEGDLAEYGTGSIMPIKIYP